MEVIMNPNWFSNGSKYNAKKVEYKGMTFDSKRELKRYQELELLQEAGEISNLQRQVKYVLIPAQREADIIGVKGGVKKGKVIERECAYTADFVYEEGGETVVEDSKGFKTKDYSIKRKLMLYVYGIKIKEV
jgi:hypothetical protein